MDSCCSFQCGEKTRKPRQRAGYTMGDIRIIDPRNRCPIYVDRIGRGATSAPGSCRVNPWQKGGIAGALLSFPLIVGASFK